MKILMPISARSQATLGWNKYECTFFALPAWIPEGFRNVNWQVYIILCSDDSLYTGITTDVERRLVEHASGTGAKYFRGRSPRRLVYLEGGHDRSSASRREAEIKRLRLPEKRRLIAEPGKVSA